MAKLAAAEVAALDPYKLMAVIGKIVIRPGGGRPRGRCSPGPASPPPARSLMSAAGVATTAVEIAGRNGAQVTAIDIAPLILEGPKPTSAPPG